MMDEAAKRIEQRAGQTASVSEQFDSPEVTNGQTSTKHMDGYDSN
jgi:hypothetical protein